MDNKPSRVEAPTPPRPPSDAGYKPNIFGIMLDIALNTAIPLGCYFLAKRYLTHSEFKALLIASIYPILTNIYEITRHKDINPISAVILLGLRATRLRSLSAAAPNCF